MSGETQAAREKRMGTDLNGWERRSGALEWEQLDGGGLDGLDGRVGQNTRDSRKYYVIEDYGKYRGMDWVVRFVEMGHRCGYVRIEDDALFDKYVKENDENIMIPSLDVHGGITFIEKLEDGNRLGLPAGNWLGFDAAHVWDITDYQSARKYFGNSERYDQREQMDLRHCIKDASIKTKEYMVTECKSLIDQILGGKK